MSDAVGSPALARFAATVLAVDTTPEAFSFDARRDVARHGVTTSNALTVSGINAPAAISIAGGEYSVDGGTYTAAPGSVGNGQQVSVRLVASSSYSTTTTATLTIGGVSANFNATTPSTFSSAPYLPLAIGNNWTMSPAGGYSITGMRVVNGESTFVLSSSDGSEIYLTNDALGVHIHGTYTPPQPIAGCSAAAETDIFSPPLVLASTGASQGRAADSNGTVTVDLGACGTASFGYWAMSTPQAPEVVAVPAGKFEAVRLDLNITVNGVMIGSMRYWLAAGIGFVKQADGTGAVSELESTKVVRTEPDPIQFASRTGVPLGGLVESNPVTITGITGAAPLSIAGGEYSIDGGAYRGTAGTVANGDTLKVRLTSPAAGNTASSATLAVGDLAAVFAATTSKAWSLLPGWNLLGNGASGALDVAAALGDAAKVATVWKWVPGALKWALYTPSLSAAELSAYAAGKGYDVLVTVNGGEGFWVNARTGFDIQSPSGTPIASTSLYSMNSGWNLVAVGDDKTPVQLNAAMGDLTTLWAWDPATSRWYFYAPSLDAQGGTALADYIAAKGYRDFAADSKKLDPWTGFWVNKP
ncbi:MAG: hypothetical protein HYU75_02425 [Betaproteobacteria bacterium]|nr:hypothetical protein [Betaproteobacteria bacterium]